MTCYHRKLAWLVPNGENRGMYFGYKPKGVAIQCYVPCGKCTACRVNKANEWALRCYHEMQYVEKSCFLTLTYANEYLPENSSVVKSDVQKFMKRLRKYHLVRSYMAVGEYGSARRRPHYHLCIFGWSPSNPIPFGRSRSGNMLYNDAELSRLWRFGWAVSEDCNVLSAAYLARYSKKMIKSDSPLAEEPFCLTSRNIRLSNGAQGAIGAQWLCDFVERNGLNLPYFSVGEKKYPVPRYYLKLLEKWYPEQKERVIQMKKDYLASDVDCPYCLAYVGESREAVALDGHILDPYECEYWTKRLLEAEDMQKKSLSTLQRPLDI